MKSPANSTILKGILICIMALPVGLKAATSSGQANPRGSETTLLDVPVMPEPSIPDEAPLASTGVLDANAPTAAAGLVKRLLPEHSDRLSEKRSGGFYSLPD